MVADLVPGSNGSEPSELKVYDGELYFNAHMDHLATGDFVRGLWKYDGTNFSMIADSVMSTDWGLTVFNNELYFTASDGIHGYELWKYNGTNVSMVVDMNSNFPDYDPFMDGFYSSSLAYPIAVFDNELYFSGMPDFLNNSQVSEMWKTDGINTSMVASKSE